MRPLFVEIGRYRINLALVTSVFVDRVGREDHAIVGFAGEHTFTLRGDEAQALLDVIDAIAGGDAPRPEVR